MELELGKYIFLKEHEIIENDICFIEEPINQLKGKIENSDSKRIILNGPKGSGKTVLINSLRDNASIFYRVSRDRLATSSAPKNLDMLVEINIAITMLENAKRIDETLFNRYLIDDYVYIKRIYSEIVFYFDVKRKSENERKITKGQYTVLLLEKIKNIYKLLELKYLIDDFDLQNECVQIKYEEYFDMFDSIILGVGDVSLYENTDMRKRMLGQGYEIIDVEYGNNLNHVISVINARIKYYNLKSDQKNIPDIESVFDLDTIKYMIEKMNGNINLILSALYRVCMTNCFLQRKPDKEVIKQSLYRFIDEVLLGEARNDMLLRKRNLHL